MFDAVSRIRPRTWLALLLVLLVSVFTIGLFAGNWLSDNDAQRRVQIYLNQMRSGEPGRALSRLVKTHYYYLEVREVPLDPFQATGGALQEFRDGVLVVSPWGKIASVSGDGSVHYAEHVVPMNKGALDEAVLPDDFLTSRFRVADILIRDTGDGRKELLVSHHYFAEGCVEFRISSIEIETGPDPLQLTGSWKLIYRARPCIKLGEPTFKGHEAGGRMLLDGDDHLLIAIGEHGLEVVDGLKVAMDPGSDLGKLLRIDLDTGRSEIIASGLRNPQGFTRDSDGNLWESEHGPKGGDELNLLFPGENYGWPEVTYGMQYDDQDWPHNPVPGWHEGYRKPIHAWLPSIGISSIVFSDGDEFPAWQSDLLVSSLLKETLYRTRIDDGRVMYVEPIPLGVRIRDLIELPDGSIVVLSGTGQVLFITRAPQ